MTGMARAAGEKRHYCNLQGVVLFICILVFMITIIVCGHLIKKKSVTLFLVHLGSILFYPKPLPRPLPSILHVHV